MNAKRFVLAWLAVFVFALVWNGLVHLVFLREANMALAQFARPPAERSVFLALVLTVGVAFLFVYSYTSFIHTSGMWQGVRHGALFGLLAGLLVDLNQFLVYPIPGSLAFTWFLFGFVEFCFYGVLVAAIYRPGARPSVPASVAR